jgi:hypothetical protein
MRRVTGSAFDPRLHDKRPAALLVTLALGITVTGCAPLVGLKRLSARDVGRSYTSNVLSTDDLSDVTRIALRRHSLTEQFDDQPEVALAQLHTIAVNDSANNDDLLPWRSYRAPTANAAASNPTISGNREDTMQEPGAMDPRYRWACDIYDRALILGFKAWKGDNLEPREVRYALPFGALDVYFDQADLVWRDRHLKDFVPVAEFEVIGCATATVRTASGRRWRPPRNARTPARPATTSSAPSSGSPSPRSWCSTTHANTDSHE